MRKRTRGFWSAKLGVVLRRSDHFCDDCWDTRSNSPKLSLSTAGVLGKRRRAPRGGARSAAAPRPNTRASSNAEMYKDATIESIADLAPTLTAEFLRAAAEVEKLKSQLSELKQDPLRLRTLSSSDIHALTGLPSWDAIDRLAKKVLPTKSRGRTWRHRLGVNQALALTLHWLRTGASDAVLAAFWRRSKSTTRRVRRRLLRRLAKLARKELKLPALADVLLDVHTSLGGKRILVVVDTTYIYVTKSNSQAVQYLTYDGVYKKRHHVKVLVLCTPSGRVLYVSGLYAAGAKAPDNIILDHAVASDPELESWLAGVGDAGLCAAVDKGFVRQQALTHCGVECLAPVRLGKNKTSLSAEESDKSRQCTEVRWVVECAIRQLKEWRVLSGGSPSGVVDVRTLPRVLDIVRVCALLNNEYKKKYD